MHKNTFSNKDKKHGRDAHAAKFFAIFETFWAASSLNTLKRYMSEHEKHFEPNKELQNELKRLFSTADAVPPEVDRKIIEMADKHFAGRKKTGRVVVLRWAGRVAAAAAIILVTAILYMQFENKTTQYRAEKSVAVVSESSNPTAKMTILDAFTLAKNIDAGRKVDKSWDLNGDGIIDKRDVDAVAFAAVRLHNGV